MTTKFSEETDGRQRRIVLQGALAACCALALPTLSGCGKSKEPASPATTTGAATPPVPQAGGQDASPSSPQGGTKVSKAQVHYQEQPKGDQKCSTCNNFIAASNTCKLVEGQINPNGWCQLWVLKQG